MTLFLDANKISFWYLISLSFDILIQAKLPTERGKVQDKFYHWNRNQIIWRVLIWLTGKYDDIIFRVK